MSDELLTAVALVEGLTLAALILVLVARRLVAGPLARRRVRRHAPLVAAARAWQTGGDPAPVARALATLPPHEAVEGLLELVAQVPDAATRPLADAVRAHGDPRWLRRTLAGAASRRWTVRLVAARTLAPLALERDRALVDRLLADENPAVRAAAAIALPRVGDDALVELVVASLPAQPEAMRRQLEVALRPLWEPATRALAERLAQPAATSSLVAWLELAAVLGVHAALPPMLALGRHAEAEVRAAAVRGLAAAWAPEAEALLLAALADPSADVRAAAAWALGVRAASTGLSPQAVLAALRARLEDPAWPVRLQAALALAQSGAAGRRLLREAREGTDRFARDMAGLVSGLPDGALAALAA